jgi:hypothetical protein
MSFIKLFSEAGCICTGKGHNKRSITEAKVKEVHEIQRQAARLLRMRAF